MYCTDEPLKKLFKSLIEEVNPERTAKAISLFKKSLKRFDMQQLSKPRKSRTTRSVKTSVSSERGIASALVFPFIQSIAEAIRLALPSARSIAEAIRYFSSNPSAAPAAAGAIALAMTISNSMPPASGDKVMKVSRQSESAIVKGPSRMENYTASTGTADDQAVSLGMDEIPGIPIIPDQEAWERYMSANKFADDHFYGLALEEYKRVAYIVEDRLGKEYPGLDSIYANIGRMYLVQANYEDARKNTEKALEISRKRDGETSLDYAAFLDAMAAVYLVEGNDREAVKLGEEEFSIRRSVELRSGRIDPRVTIIANNIAGSFLRLRNTPEARYYLQMVVTRIPATPNYPGFTELNRKTVELLQDPRLQAFPASLFSRVALR